jgi:hypothetical protein
VHDPVGEVAVEVDVAKPPLAEEAAVGDGAGGEIDRDARRARAASETTRAESLTPIATPS